MDAEHICKENDTLTHLGECRITKDDGEWDMSVDDGCCHFTPLYCPFCGTKLD